MANSTPGKLVDAAMDAAWKRLGYFPKREEVECVCLSTVLALRHDVQDMWHLGDDNPAEVRRAVAAVMRFRALIAEAESAGVMGDG